MTKSTKIILSAVTVLVIGAITFFVFHKKESDLSLNNEESATTTSSGIGKTIGFNDSTAEITLSNGQKIKAQALNADELAKIPKPNLDRPIVVTNTSIDLSTKDQIINTIKQTIASIKKQPYSFDTWIMLGTQFKIIGDYQSAREMWEYVTKANPAEIAARSNLGDLYAHYLKDYPKAEMYLKQVIVNDPTYINGYLNLFDLYRYYYKKDTTLAADTLKQGISKNKNAVDLYTALAGYYKENGDNANAKLYYGQALSIAKNLKDNALIQSISQSLTELK